MNNDLISRERLCEKIRLVQREAQQKMVDAGYNDDCMGALLWSVQCQVWEQAYSMVMQEPIVKNGE